MYGRPVSVGTLCHHSCHTGGRAGDCASPVYRVCALYVVVTAAALGPKEFRTSTRKTTHTRGDGIELYRMACQLDLKGIVAKRADSPYEEHPADPHWIKIKNPDYSQKEGRGDLFKRAG